MGQPLAARPLADRLAVVVSLPAGALLDHAGGYIDPLRVVSQIPPHMQARRGGAGRLEVDLRCLSAVANQLPDQPPRPSTEPHLPPTPQVEDLRGRLVRIIGDFRTHMSLQQGCNAILAHDCAVLANRLYR